MLDSGAVPPASSVGVVMQMKGCGHADTGGSSILCAGGGGDCPLLSPDSPNLHNGMSAVSVGGAFLCAAPEFSCHTYFFVYRILVPLFLRVQGGVQAPPLPAVLTTTL